LIRRSEDEDDDGDDGNKNAFIPAKRRMKAFSESRGALARRAGLILLFDGEVGKRVDGL